MRIAPGNSHRFFQALMIGTVLWCAVASAKECDEQYFTIDASGHEVAVSTPVKHFAVTLKKARAGDVLEQRNLAVSYEVGYLISACHEKAAYWYKKAADSGDPVARLWLRESQSRAALRRGPECSEEQCRNDSSTENRTAVLYTDASKGNHYFAPVTINGKTAIGMIDTGASMVAMSSEQAKIYGIDTSRGRASTAMTANGKIDTTNLLVPLIEIAGIQLRNVPISIGLTGGILIGMSFLRRLDVTMGTGTLTLNKR